MHLLWSRYTFDSRTKLENTSGLDWPGRAAEELCHEGSYPCLPYLDEGVVPHIMYYDPW